MLTSDGFSTLPTLTPDKILTLTDEQLRYGLREYRDDQLSVANVCAILLHWNNPTATNYAAECARLRESYNHLWVEYRARGLTEQLIRDAEALIERTQS